MRVARRCCAVPVSEQSPYDEQAVTAYSAFGSKAVAQIVKADVLQLCAPANPFPHLLKPDEIAFIAIAWEDAANPALASAFFIPLPLEP